MVFYNCGQSYRSYMDSQYVCGHMAKQAFNGNIDSSGRIARAEIQVAPIETEAGMARAENQVAAIETDNPRSRSPGKMAM